MVDDAPAADLPDALRAPAPHVRAAARAALASPPRELAALAGLYHRLSGQPHELAALVALCDPAREPAFGATLFERVVPALLRALLAFPREPVPLLLEGRAARVALPRPVVASIVAHMFFGTLPAIEGRAMPRAAFDALLARTRAPDLARLRCMLAYFDRLADAPAPEALADIVPGALTLERDVLPLPARDEAGWAEDPSALGPFELAPRGGVEDSPDAVQVDFANRFLGGGVLTHGCVQEEIRFSECPELLAGMALCEAMADHEAIRLHGAERFARTRGYAFELEYEGPASHTGQRLPDGTPDVTLVAIDALDLRRAPDPAVQFARPMLVRELAKAFVGFGGARNGGDGARRETVATGHWGCGAFRGHHALKAVLQWLAASSAGAVLRYHTFGDERAGDLAGFTRAARARFGAVGALWQRLLAVAPGLARQPAPDAQALYDALLVSAA